MPLATDTSSNQQADGRMRYRVHFLSQFEANGCEFVDMLAYHLEHVDERTVKADGVMIQFTGQVAEVVSALPR